MTVLETQGLAAKHAARILAVAGTSAKNAALEAVARQLAAHSGEILAANRLDLDEATGMRPSLVDRLTLTQARIDSMVEGVRQVAALPDPVEEGENRLMLAGVLCRKPVARRTPLGREICDLLLAVNRPYGRADYLPCIAWGSLAAHCGGLDVGDRLRLEGRLQSRQYHKLIDGEQVERTAFEVSVMNLLDSAEPS